MTGDYARDHFHQYIVWGILLQCFGVLVPISQNRPILAILGGAMVLGGSLLVIAGFAAYARTKGRSPAWSLLALASVVGWIILVSLQPRPAGALTGDSSKRAA